MSEIIHFTFSLLITKFDLSAKEEGEESEWMNFLNGISFLFAFHTSREGLYFFVYPQYEINKEPNWGNKETLDQRF